MSAKKTDEYNSPEKKFSRKKVLEFALSGKFNTPGTILVLGGDNMNDVREGLHLKLINPKIHRVVSLEGGSATTTKEDEENIIKRQKRMLAGFKAHYGLISTVIHANLWDGKWEHKIRELGFPPVIAVIGDVCGQCDGKSQVFFERHIEENKDIYALSVRMGFTFNTLDRGHRDNPYQIQLRRAIETGKTFGKPTDFYTDFYYSFMKKVEDMSPSGLDSREKLRDIYAAYCQIMLFTPRGIKKRFHGALKYKNNMFNLFFTFSH